MDIDLQSAGAEQPMDFLKGMDHALMLHSSKCPRQNGYVECIRFGLGSEIFKSYCFKLDMISELGGRVFLRPSDARLEWVDGRDPHGLFGIAPGQATVTASDFQYICAREVHHTAKGMNFVVLRILSNCHLSPYWLVMRAFLLLAGREF
jgi:hypothetical protein